MRLNRIKRITIYQLCLAAVSLTIFSIIGCGGSGGGDSSSPAPPAPNQSSPNIKVDQTSLSFGDIVLDKFSDQFISIQNTGPSTLIVGQIAQSNPVSAPFSILADECSGNQLAQWQTCVLQVRFSPSLQGAFQETFDIPSNDPGETSVTVSLSGYGRGMNLSISRLYTDNCPKVSLLVTATDKNANPLVGLTIDSFSLYESGVAKAIGRVDQVKLPISVALVLDYSSSMYWAKFLPDLEMAAKGFIDQLKPENGDAAEIIKFAANIYRMQDFTPNQADLKTAIDTLPYTPYPGDNKGTRMYDALWWAVDDLASRTNLRAIIVISDGKDDASTKSLTEVIAHCHEKEVNVFTIGLGTVDAVEMQQLATQTGGQYFFAPTPSQLEDIYLKIASIIAGQYLIEYNSSGGAPVNLDLEAVWNNLQGKASTEFSGCP